MRDFPHDCGMVDTYDIDTRMKIHQGKKVTPRAPRGIWRWLGGTHCKMWERSQTAGPIGNNFGTRMHTQARSQDLERGVHFRCQLTEGSVFVTQLFQLGLGGVVSTPAGPGQSP